MKRKIRVPCIRMRIFLLTHLCVGQTIFIFYFRWDFQNKTKQSHESGMLMVSYCIFIEIDSTELVRLGLFILLDHVEVHFCLFSFFFSLFANLRSILSMKNRSQISINSHEIHVKSQTDRRCFLESINLIRM